MDFVSYKHLILQISGQKLQVTVARENFWKGALRFAPRWWFSGDVDAQ